MTVFSEFNSSRDRSMQGKFLNAGYHPSFSVESTMLAELSQQNNRLLSQLNARVDPTTFGTWSNNKPSF